MDVELSEYDLGQPDLLVVRDSPQPLVEVLRNVDGTFALVGNQPKFGGSLSPYSLHFGNQDPRIGGSSVFSGPKHGHLTKARSLKLFEEGNSFPGAGYSSQPVGLVAHFLRQGLGQD